MRRRIYQWTYAFEKLLDIRQDASTVTTVYDNHLCNIPSISQFLPTMLFCIDHEFGAENIEDSMLYVLCLFQLAIRRAAISLTRNNVITLLALSVSAYDKLVSDDPFGLTLLSCYLNCTIEDAWKKEAQFLNDLQFDLRVDDSHMHTMRDDIMKQLFIEDHLFCHEHMSPNKSVQISLHHGRQTIAKGNSRVMIRSHVSKYSYVK